MIRYTTPSISLKLKDVDLTGNNVYVTLEQMNLKLTKTGIDLVIEQDEEDTDISFSLTQEESAMFNFDKACSIQVNYINSAGVRGASEIKGIPVMRNLLDEVIEYAD